MIREVLGVTWQTTSRRASCNQMENTGWRLRLARAARRSQFEFMALAQPSLCSIPGPEGQTALHPRG